MLVHVFFYLFFAQSSTSTLKQYKHCIRYVCIRLCNLCSCTQCNIIQQPIRFQFTVVVMSSACFHQVTVFCTTTIKRKKGKQYIACYSYAINSSFSVQGGVLRQKQLLCTRCSMKVVAAVMYKMQYGYSSSCYVLHSQVISIG